MCELCKNAQTGDIWYKPSFGEDPTEKILCVFSKPGGDMESFWTEFHPDRTRRQFVGCITNLSMRRTYREVLAEQALIYGRAIIANNEHIEKLKQDTVRFENSLTNLNRLLLETPE